MPNHLLFFHAPNREQVAQCRYFLLKYLAAYNLKPPRSTSVWVYTYEPVAFEGFLNFVPQFNMQDLAALPPNATQAHILQHLLEQTTGNVVYCHTATYPLLPLEPLFADIEKGALYLQALHRYPETELTKALRKFTSLLDKTATTNVKPVPKQVSVWHAAVAGLNDSYKPLIDEVLQEETTPENPLASDYTYTKIFSAAGPVKSAGKFIFDYSPFTEFNQLLQVFFRKNEEESIPNQVKALHHIDAAAIQQQKEQFQQLPVLKKWMQVLTGKRWSIQQYEQKF